MITRLCSTGWVGWFYILQTLRFWDMCFVYPRWKIASTDVASWAPLVALLLPLIWGGIQWWRSRLQVSSLSFLWCVYLLSVFPVIGIADVFYWRYSYVGDHYVYQSLPVILGIYMSVVAKVATLVRPYLAVDIPPKLLRIFCGVLVAILALFSHLRTYVYESQNSLWLDTVQRNPQAALAWSQLGWLNDDEEYSRRAVEIDDSLFESWLNLGNKARERLDWGAAKFCFEKATGCPPGELRVAMKIQVIGAMACAGEFTEAIERAEVLTQSPMYSSVTMIDDANLSVYLSHALRQAGRVTEADRVLANIADLLQSEDPELEQVAWALEDVGELQSAKHVLESIVARGGSNEKILSGLGRIAINLGDFGSAISVLRKALEISPQMAHARNYLGIAIASNGDIQSAASEFAKAVELAPAESRYLANYAKALLSLKQFPEAAQALKRIAELAPDSVSAWQSLAWLQATAPAGVLSNGVVRESISNAQRACKLSNYSDLPSLVALAAAWAANDDFDKAVEVTQQAIAKLPATPSALSGEVLEGHLESYRNHKSLQSQ